MAVLKTYNNSKKIVLKYCCYLASCFFSHVLTCQIKYKLVQNQRIKTEEKANIVAAAWGAKLVQFLAALAILYQGRFEE